MVDTLRIPHDPQAPVLLTISIYMALYTAPLGGFILSWLAVFIALGIEAGTWLADRHPAQRHEVGVLADIDAKNRAHVPLLSHRVRRLGRSWMTLHRATFITECLPLG